MTEDTKTKGRRFLPAVIAAVMVLTLIIGFFAYVTLSSDQRILVPDLTSDHSNVAARGVVTAIYPNFTSYGLGGPHMKPYHLFPAVVVLNLTGILWTRDDINSSITYWKNPHSLGVPFRDVALVYDASDVPALTTGDPVEFSGYYERVTDMVNSFFVTISPSVNGSYMKTISLAQLSESNAKLANSGYLKVPSLPSVERRQQTFLGLSNLNLWHAQRTSVFHH